MTQTLITQLLFGLVGILLFLLGVWSFLVHHPLLRKLIALNVMGAGSFTYWSPSPTAAWRRRRIRFPKPWY